jgi:Icc-related predicted phosphoesterase
MRVHVVSDVHGSADALARAGEGADLLICLGDLVLFLDYAEPSRGIFADLFGEADTRRFIELRTAGRFAEARDFTAALWRRIGGDRDTHLDAAVRAQYAELFAAMPAPALLTYGNVDVPSLWPDFLREGHTLLDGAAVEVGGVRIGMVGGGLISPYRTPYELTDEEFAAKVLAMGAVDILCSHIPPSVPELTYDVVARRFERGSTALLGAVLEQQPALMLFGHVHQPLAARMRIGRTECVNVGHFAADGRPFAFTLPG